MVERGHSAGLALEALGELSLGDFDSDDAAETRIAHLPHFAHAAFGKQRSDLVTAESSANR